MIQANDIYVLCNKPSSVSTFISNVFPIQGYILCELLFVFLIRNYHVFYYLLLGASEEERKEFKLLPPEEYFYLKQVCSPVPSSAVA